MPARKPAAALAPRQATAIDPSSPEAIGAAQLWRARGLGAVDTLKQVVEQMAKSLRKSDVANVRNDCRLVGGIGDAIMQSLPAPNKKVDTLFRQAAGSVKAGALKCHSLGTRAVEEPDRRLPDGHEGRRQRHQSDEKPSGR